LAPNEGIEIKATGSVRLSLQSKGGVRKRLIAQHPGSVPQPQSPGGPLHRLRPGQQTLSQYKGLRVTVAGLRRW